MTTYYSTRSTRARQRRKTIAAIIGSVLAAVLVYAVIFAVMAIF